MVNQVPVGPHEPVLALKAGGQVLALSVNQLIYRFRKWLLLVGYDPSLFSLHSLRRGGPHSHINLTWKEK